MKRRIFALLAAASAGALIAATPASGANEWEAHSGPPSGWTHRKAESTAGSVYEKTDIWWYEKSAAVHAYVKDLKADGYCGGVQIRYEYMNGTEWSGDWHYRTPAYDCSDGNGGVTSPYYFSLTAVRKVQARACHTNTSGSIIECEQNWH